MKQAIVALGAAVLMAGLAGRALANSAPVVSNITVSQRTDGSKKVDIRYNLSDADGDRCTVSVQVSSDDGATWTVPAVSFSGDIGAGIRPGTGRSIVWDCAADLPGAYGTNYKVKVAADDGYEPPVGPDMVLIPSGTFQMGDSFAEGRSDELPVHTVKLDSFYMGRYEITNEQYCVFLNWTDDNGWITVTSGVVYKAGSGTSYPYCDTSTSSSYSQIAYGGGVFSVRTKSGRSMVNDPMVMVSWYGAVAYCNWRSQQGGKEQCYNLSTWNCDFGKHGYRLATEAEWEYAARGGLSGRRFPWGNDIYHTQANYYSDAGYSYDKGPTRGFHPLWNDGIWPHTSPVGFFDGTMKYKAGYNWPGSTTSYQTTSGANSRGLYDMAGNVWEWCNDWYSSTYYSSSPTGNPTGPITGTDRVLRGGCWDRVAWRCRAALRTYLRPGDDRVDCVGFRIVLGAASAATGSAISGRFTIDNRTGSGFRITSLTATYGGVFPEGVDVINTFTATVDWAGKTPSKVVFELNGAAHNVTTSGSNATKTFNMGDDLEYSRSGAKNDLVAYGVDANGTQSSPGQLNLWGLALPEWAISKETKPNHPHGNPDDPRIGWRLEPLTGKVTFYGEVEVLKERPGGTVNVPDWIPEIGGKYGVEINPLNFEWELSAQPRYGDGAGLTGSFDLSGTWGAEASCGTKRKGEISATLSGEGEFYPQFRLTDVSAELAGKFTFLFPRVPLLCHWGCCHTGYCPYFQASIAPEVKGTVGMEEGEPSLIAGLKFKNAELELGVTVAGTIGAGSEGSIYYIAGTIGGNPYVVLQFPPDPASSCLNEYIKKVAFDLVARYVVECAWWKKEYEIEFNLYTCPETGMVYVLAAPALERRTVPVGREYLRAQEGYCVFPSKKGGIGLLAVGGLPEPITNVGTGPMPSVAATSNEGLLLFIFDANDKPMGKHQEIYYARWTGSQWTAHAPLTDNVRPDLFPAAAIGPAGEGIAVWVTAPEPNGLETGPRDVLPGFEIIFSKYDSGASSWTPPQAITGNDFVDILPWFERLPGGEMRVCWIASPANAIPVWHDEAVAPSLDVMAADWNGTTFGDPYSVATGLATVSPPSVCHTDTREFLTYLADTDANSATGDDREVMARVREIGEAWEADVQLTDDALSDTATQVAVDEIGIPTIVWVKRMVPTPLPDGNDTYVDQLWFAIWDSNSWSEPLLGFEAAGIAEPKLIRNEAGRLMVFWVAASEEFSDIYYSAYDSASMQWSLPQQITHDQGAETMLSLAESGGNILAGYVKRRIDLSDANLPPQIGLSDIYLLEHIPAKDLFISPNDISVSVAPNLEGLAGFCSYWLEEGCGEPNGWCQEADLDQTGTVDFNDYSLFVRDYGRIAKIYADIHLSGDFVVENVNVSFYDGDPDSGTLIGSKIVDRILPGDANQVCVSWYVPSDKQTHRIYVVVDPNNEIPETDDIANNEAYVTLFKPDIDADSVAVLGYPGPNTVLVGFSVTNDGQGTAESFTCQIRKGDEAGEILHTVQIPALEPEASTQSQFAWDVSGEDANNYTLVLVADANDQIDESDENNNTVSIQFPVLPDLEAMQWSAHIEAGTAYVMIRNVGAKPSQATVVRATSGEAALGEAAMEALDPGDSVDVSIPISEPAPGETVKIIVNPDSDGSDEVSLLNNTAIVIL